MQTYSRAEPLRPWNVEVFADLPYKKVVDLLVAWNGGDFTRGTIHINTVAPTLTEELNTVLFEMTNQINPLHEMEASGSRMTIVFRSAS